MPYGRNDKWLVLKRSLQKKELELDKKDAIRLSQTQEIKKNNI